MSEVMINQSEQLLKGWMNEMNNRMDGQQYENMNGIRNDIMNSIVIENVDQ